MKIFLFYFEMAIKIIGSVGLAETHLFLFRPKSRFNTKTSSRNRNFRTVVSLLYAHYHIFFFLSCK